MNRRAAGLTTIEKVTIDQLLILVSVLSVVNSYADYWASHSTPPC
jgi:hypothetical protein